MRTIDDMVQAMGLLEIAGVTAFGLSAHRTDDEGSDGDEVDTILSQMRVLFRENEEYLSVRIQTEQPTPGAVAEVDLAVAYRKLESFTLAVELREQFIQLYAIPALFPYIRQHVHDLTSRLGVPSLLPLLRVGTGTIQLGDPDQDE